MAVARLFLLLTTLTICAVWAQAQPPGDRLTANPVDSQKNLSAVVYADKSTAHALDSYLSVQNVSSPPDDPLAFNPNRKSTTGTLTFLDGKTVNYRSYEVIYYVANVADSAYQYLNVYIPESAYTNNSKTPVFFRTYVGGYFSSKAQAPVNTDASGRALQEGYVVVIPGARGWNANVTKPDASTVYTGRAPAGIVDLKAAIRYLRHNDAVMAGDAERIITDGTSAGGAMSSLLGATGNHPAYEPYLQALGAAQARDDVFATVAYCPIIDLDHADMVYEWLYSGTNTGVRSLSSAQAAISNELAAQFPAYQKSLGLKMPDGTPLTADNYRDYIKSFLIKSAQKAKDAGADMPANSGVKLNTGFRGSPGEFVVNIDLDTYLNYVVGKTPLKTPPAFDKMGTLGPDATPENQVFGDVTGKPTNYTDFSLRKATGNPVATVDKTISDRVYLMNPMNFIGDTKATSTKNWYIRHGASDRDTGFPIPINLYTKLINKGYEVDFALPWNRPHSGDYNLDDVFSWMDKVVKAAKKR
ncbi:subtype B tannase [Spirosoma flavum]|uniref:Subtype B tannase n=1 Tax=Spirosoma flavum TaxID=2048557 RepID=A0ABW6ASZ4_9BACT